MKTSFNNINRNYEFPVRSSLKTNNMQSFDNKNNLPRCVQFSDEQPLFRNNYKPYIPQVNRRLNDSRQSNNRYIDNNRSYNYSPRNQRNDDKKTFTTPLIIVV